MTDKEKAFAAIDASDKGVVELETLLSAIPAFAPESGGVGELEKCEALEKWLKGHGIDRLERFDSPDDRVPSGRRPNLVATIPGRSDAGRLWIMAHTDVVPEGDRSMWRSDPFKVVYEGGRLVGRGVEDNQQGLVGSVFAALALVKNGIVPPHTVKLLFVADEEVGSVHGIQYLLGNTKLFRPDDLFIVPDGGVADGSEIEVAEKNICWLKIITKGRQTHAAMPDKGANAFLAASDLAVRIHGLEKTVFTDRDPLFDPDRSTVNPTKKEANVPNVNTIPGDDVFYVDMRILPQYSVDMALAEISRLMRDIEAKYGVSVSYEVVQRNESKATPADAPVVKALAGAVKEVYGVTAKPIGIGGGTVAAYLRKAGYDAVVWATMEETAHQPNESALMKNILGDAKVFASLMLRD
ncbi:MAG TPA: M20 family metallo-hydrolase [Rectinemataceae bacterium]|nr:M20 family metallo-hydrolase [Rectinemataceae bacterium]